MGDRTGDSTAGEMMGDLVSELRGDEAGRLMGEAAVRVGEGTEEGSWTGGGEGHSGLLAAGEGVEPSVFLSSGMNGSGKKRAPGDFTSVIWKRKKEDQDLVITNITYLPLETCGIVLPVVQALETV